MKRMELHEVGHRIYTIGRAYTIGLSQYELKDQSGKVLLQGRYAECISALQMLKRTAARKAWIGHPAIT